MIEKCIERWHEVVRGNLEVLDELLAKDVVFLSPIVFTPQQGKDVTKLYLAAAFGTFGGQGRKEGGDGTMPKFRYVKEVLSGSHAILEFETEVGGKYVNGVDIITCNDAGQITEFKVMIRPLQAVNLMHAQMKAMLEKMQGATA